VTQEEFLSELKNQKSHVFIYLVNGIKLQGNIEDYHENVLFLKGTNKITQMIFKDAISTIFPEQNIEKF